MTSMGMDIDRDSHDPHQNQHHLLPALSPVLTPPTPSTPRSSSAAVTPPLAALEPLSGADALCVYGEQLTEFERDEVLGFGEVWYCGQHAAGRKIAAERGGPRNGGYDDGSGRYLYVPDDHVAYRWKLAEPLGKGAFGDCFRAYDCKRRQWVALKIIKNEPRYHRQGKVEVSVLEKLRFEDAAMGGACSLVHMLDHTVFRSHLVITFELLGPNLYTTLKASKFAGFEISSTRDVCCDIVRCLELLARLGVVHADLKPENVLLRPAAAAVGVGPASVAKVIDFGSSCFQHGRVHTYIQSRYYRSPEVVLGLGYGPAIDMWSLGTILAELDSGHPLFPAKNERDLLLLQMEVLGTPPQQVLEAAHRATEFFDGAGSPLTTVDRKGRTRLPGARPLAAALRSSAEPAFVDFVARCLTWDPAERLTPVEAMRHPWLQQPAAAVQLAKATAKLAAADAGIAAVSG